MNDRESIFLKDIYTEVEAARTKFPEQDVWVTLAALTEEVGELNQAILQYHYQPQKGKNKNDIYNEAVQVAAMAMRVIFDTGLNK